MSHRMTKLNFFCEHKQRTKKEKSINTLESLLSFFFPHNSRRFLQLLFGEDGGVRAVQYLQHPSPNDSEMFKTVQGHHYFFSL